MRSNGQGPTSGSSNNSGPGGHGNSGRPDSRIRISRPEEAEDIVRSALEALETLEPLIAEETALFRAGKVRAALSLAMEKNEAAQHYSRCLEVLKGNAIAIGRFRPEGLELLKKRHEVFSEAMALNMAVVSTARTVSEGLLRDLADVVGKNASPKTYAKGQILRKPGTTPLSVSKVS